MKQTRNLEDLLRQYDLLAAPAARDAAVTGICNDSRQARDGDLFICKGYGFKPEYLAMARSRGAVCALAEADFPGVDIPCIRVTDVRKAQSLAARWFYDNPSDGLTLIGVTGTKGKTTTSYMIQAVTNALAGRTMGLSSSAGRYCGGPDVDTHLTTPESLDLQWLFAQARDHGLPYMTAEVSSQAYQVERVYGEHFDIGVFLNFSEDHISPKEHASMEEYLQCKLQLLENSGRAVICRETAQFDRVYDTARRCCRAVMLVGMDRDDCDLTVRQVEKLTHGFRFFVQERGSEALHPYHLAMDGDFNIENALAAIGVTCTNPGVTAGNDYYFRICFLDPFQGTVLANFAQEKFSAKKAYCLGELGNEYDQGLISYFTKVFEAAGGTVITDSFPTNNSDFTTYLNKAKSSGADVIFTPVSIAYATQIVGLAASMGLDIPLLGSDTLDSNVVLEAAQGSNVQLYVSTFYQEGGSPKFDDGIKAWLNEDSTAMTNNGGNDTIAAVTAMGYDAYYVALEALKAAGSTDPAAVKAALPGVTYTGVTGDIAFDDIGDAIRDTAYIKVADTANNAWALETMQKAG